MKKLLLLLFPLLITCAALQTQKAGNRFTPDPAATERTALIAVQCDDEKGWRRGSGIAIDSRLILTAFHVVDCSGSYKIAVEVAGELVLAQIGKSRPEMDLSILVTEKPVHTTFPEPVFGVAPKIGDKLCQYPARDKRDPICGTALNHRLGLAKEDLAMQVEVNPGDSGAGVYNEAGELVGVVISRLRKDHPPGMVSFATLLQGKLNKEK